jgi:NADPH:quinone reductase-like Zn-dependent oxidoreductase
MKAIVLTAFGGVENLQLREVAMPPVDAGELLVRVVATSINPLDYQIRRGDYPESVPLPAIIGHDVSGVLERVGAVHFVRSLGAGEASNYEASDYVEHVSELTGGRGARWSVQAFNLPTRARRTPPSSSAATAASPLLARSSSK